MDNNENQTETILFSMPKSDNEEVRIRETTFKGKDYIDIRIYTRMQEGSDFVPTKKGIMLVREKMKVLRDALDKVNM